MNNSAVSVDDDLVDLDEDLPDDLEPVEGVPEEPMETQERESKSQEVLLLEARVELLEQQLKAEVQAQLRAMKTKAASGGHHVSAPLRPVPLRTSTGLGRECSNHHPLAPPPIQLVGQTPGPGATPALGPIRPCRPRLRGWPCARPPGPRTPPRRRSPWTSSSRLRGGRPNPEPDPGREALAPLRGGPPGRVRDEDGALRKGEEDTWDSWKELGTSWTRSRSAGEGQVQAGGTEGRKAGFSTRVGCGPFDRSRGGVHGRTDRAPVHRPLPPGLPPRHPYPTFVPGTFPPAGGQAWPPQQQWPPAGGPPWGQSPRPPWAGPAPAAQADLLGGAPYPTPQRDEEIEDLRERLQEAERRAEQEREERRVEAERAKAREAEDRFERALAAQDAKFEKLVQAVSSKDGGGMEQMLNMMTLQMTQDRQRMDREAAERRERQEREEDRRRADEKSREKSHDRRQSELDKQRDIEREQARAAAERDRDFFAKMMEMGRKGEQKPRDYIEMLAAMQGMNPQKDPTETFVAMMSAIGTVKDVFGGGGSESSAAENIVTKVTDGVQGIAEAYLSRKEEQRQVDPRQLYAAQVAAAQHLRLPPPGVQPTQEQVRAMIAHRQQQQLTYRGLQAQDPSTQNEVMAAADRAPTGEEWGVILQATMSAFAEEVEPDDFVPQLHELVVNRLGVPKAFELLDGATFMMLKLKYPSIRNDVPEGTELRVHVDMFGEVLEDPEGREWITELLGSVTRYQEAIRETAYQATANPLLEGGWTGAGGQPAAPSPNTGTGGHSPYYDQAQAAYQQHQATGVHPQHPGYVPQHQHPGYPQQHPGHPQHPGYAPQQQPQMQWVNTPQGPRLIPVSPDSRVLAADQAVSEWTPNAGAPPEAPYDQATYGSHDPAAYGLPAPEQQSAAPPRPPTGES